MDAVLSFVEYILLMVLEVAVWLVIANVIISWLVAFDVINLRNRTVYRLAGAIDQVTRPVLRPIQRVLPAMGGIDFSPFVFLILVEGVRRYLLPALFVWLHGLADPGPLIT
ncbi:MAG: YggT family protein [Alphaproteobacteria bacterium]|jgi:YggT family protein|nr:YggT family protein [Alphaproteobacteria bacterium]